MKKLLWAPMLAVVSCTRAITPPVTVEATADYAPFAARPIRTVAIVPAETPRDRGARGVVTELLVVAASSQPRWTIVEPEKVAAAMRRAPAPLAERAGRAASVVGTDAALAIRIDRFRERVGSDYGATEPASVALEILLVPAGKREAVWTASYAHTQEPLAYNFWNFWGVLRGGAKWLTAAELARIGIDEAVERLARGGPGR